MAKAAKKETAEGGKQWVVKHNYLLYKGRNYAPGEVIPLEEVDYPSFADEVVEASEVEAPKEQE